MKLPSYSSGAQGSLPTAVALEQDALRPYAEVRHFDQLVQKKDMHTYVEVDEDEPQPPQAPYRPAFGGVIRMVGHEPGLASRGYASFKENGEGLYGPTTKLFASSGQTDPSVTWPTFWRKGLSGPTAKWAQFARSAAAVYADFTARERSPWMSPPDIGDAVVILQDPNDSAKKLVFCISGVFPVKYVEVRVVPAGSFPVARVPSEIVRLFGGVPIPPLESDWESRGQVLLTEAEIRTACGGTAGAVSRRSPQDPAFGRYAVSPDGSRVDTVRVFREPANFYLTSTHLKMTFSASSSHRLTAYPAVVSSGATRYILISQGEALGEENPYFFNAPPSVPGESAPGSATCPVLVTYVRGVLTTFQWVYKKEQRGRFIENTHSQMQVRGGHVADIPYFFEDRFTTAAFHSSSYESVTTVTGLGGDPPRWLTVFTESWTIDQATGPAQRSSKPPVGCLSFCGAEGCWVTTYNDGAGTGASGYFITEGSITRSGSVESSGSPAPVSTRIGPLSAYYQPFSAVGQPPAWNGYNIPPYGSVAHVGAFTTREVAAVSARKIHFRPVRIFADGVEITVDLSGLYTARGIPVPVGDEVGSWYPTIISSASLPTFAPAVIPFIDVASSVLGGRQVVARIAGMVDTNQAYAGMTRGSLVTSTGDTNFSHTHRVFFIGELQQ